MSRQKFLVKTISAVVLGTGSAAVNAAGFQLLEQNASGLGNAYAGSAAVAENASTIYYNPAGMTYLPGINVSGGVNLIKPSFKFRNNGDSRGPFGSIPTGGNGGDAGNLGVVPNAYVSWQLNEKWFTGLGIGAPFGLMTEYDNNWIGQYQSTKFDIKTININPSIAYKVNDIFSLGAGVNWQYIDATYTKKAVLGPTTSGDAKLNLDGDAWGWNVGVMLQPSDDTRIGLSYRSKIKHKTSGDTTISGLPGGASLNYDAKASVDLPDTLILSGLHQLNDKWELLGDVYWTGWSSIPELRITNAGGPTDELRGAARDAVPKPKHRALRDRALGPEQFGAEFVGFWGKFAAEFGEGRKATLEGRAYPVGVAALVREAHQQAVRGLVRGVVNGEFVGVALGFGELSSVAQILRCAPERLRE